MRILVVSQYFWPENFRINDLVIDLARRGHHVTVLTGIPNYPSGKIDKNYERDPELYSCLEGVEVIRVPVVLRGESRIRLFINYISFVFSASFWGSVKLRKRQFDLVFCCQLSPVTVGIPAIILSRLKKIPLMLWVLDLWPDTLRALGVVRSEFMLNIIGKIVSFIYRNCDLVLGQSRSFIPKIKEYSGNTAVKYFPSWADEVFHDETVISKEVSKANSYFNITFAGNIGEAQDFPSILSAMELLKENKSIQWTIVGDGRLLDWLKYEVLQRGLDECVKLVGRHPVEDMPMFFQQADALLVSLKNEEVFSMTIPGKLQSYLMAGKPILAMLDGEGAEIIESNSCGVSCAAGDDKCLVDAICMLYELSVAERKSMGARSQELSNREFNRIELIDRLEIWMLQLSEKGVD